MAAFHTISKDRLIYHALFELSEASKGWLAGPPQEEVALLSRMTERLLRRRRGCDVGVGTRVAFTPDVQVCHRRGLHGTDLFGCDLAVTLNIRPERFRKTACLQLKRSESGTVVLDARQLRVLQSSVFRHQSFILAADPSSGEYRLQAAAALPATGGSQHVGGWLPLTDWLAQWLDCSIGTVPEDQEASLEALLADLLGADTPLEILRQFEFPEGVEPVRLWLRASIDASQNAT